MASHPSDRRADAGRPIAPEPPAVVERQLNAQRPSVLLKMKDEVSVDYRDGVELELEALGLLPWTQLRQQFTGILLRRLIVSVSGAEIGQLVNTARTRDASYNPPNFLTFFVVECPDGLDAEAVASELRSLPAVEYAHVAPQARLPAAWPPFVLPQDYNTSVPLGIDAEYAWGVAGGRGAGQTLVDLEGGWMLDHQDLQLNGKVPTLTVSQSSSIYEDHGTAVLGIVSALNDGVGIVGIANQSTVQLASIATTSAPHVLDSTLLPDAIVAALTSLAFGNVLLLEVELLKTAGGLQRWMPCEIEPTYFEYIRLATALGIVVIEPAGSNDVDLDTFLPPNSMVLDTSSANYEDSGAIVVGGATGGRSHAHATAVSAHGSLIDVYGLGVNVATCWVDGTGSKSAYTTTFSGTSPAAAIVAGAALSIQGMANTAYRRRFSPGELREIFRDPANGTAVTDSARVIPNLRHIADFVIGSTPDVYIRDYVGDVGNPDGVSRAMSPDIIVRNAALADPAAAFGPGSGTEDDDLLSEPVQTGHDNFVYVRLRNRGANDAAGVSATVYWAAPATLITPDAWNRIGSANIGAVPADDELVVSPAITWAQADIPGPGHYCLVALIGNANDPAPQPADFSLRPAEAWDLFVEFISVNNNVAWRNIDVVAPTVGRSGSLELDFLMRGAIDRARPMGLEIVTRLPANAEVALDAPAPLADFWRRHWAPVERDDEQRLFRLPARGRFPLPPMALEARMAVRMKIRVRLPEDAFDERKRYTVSARQVWKGIELGRVTWTIRQPAKEQRRNRTRRTR